MKATARIYTFAEGAALARRTATIVGIGVAPIDVHRFPDGESLVRLEAKGIDHAFVFRSLDHPNDKLIELLLAADALRREGVSEITLVAPYLGYMRQDCVFRPGEPHSQQVVARLLDDAFDGVVTIEPHLHRIQRLSEVFPTADARSLSAADPIAQWLRSSRDADLLVGPDVESAPWIEAVAARCDLPFVVAAKTRRGDRKVDVEIPLLDDGIRAAWIIDDIASSGMTLIATANALHAAGVPRVGAIVVHALFGERTFSQLTEAKVDVVVSTDTISHPSNEISVSTLLAADLESHWEKGGAS